MRGPEGLGDAAVGRRPPDHVRGLFERGAFALHPDPLARHHRPGRLDERPLSGTSRDSREEGVADRNEVRRVPRDGTAIDGDVVPATPLERGVVEADEVRERHGERLDASAPRRFRARSDQSIGLPASSFSIMLFRLPRFPSSGACKSAFFAAARASFVFPCAAWARASPTFTGHASGCFFALRR